MFTKDELIILRDVMDEIKDNYLEGEREPEIWEPLNKLYNKIVKIIKED